MKSRRLTRVRQSILTVGLRVCAVVVCSFVMTSSVANTETLQYDALGRLTYVTQDNGAVVAYSYDPAGNRTQVTITGNSAGASCPDLNDEPIDWIVNGKWCTSGEVYIPGIADGTTQTIVDYGRFIWSGSATYVCQNGTRVIQNATCN